eukprot:14218306-Alexandrium_andersonii.AAC.1
MSAVLQAALAGPEYLAGAPVMGCPAGSASSSRALALASPPRFSASLTSRGSGRPRGFMPLTS